MSDVNRIVIGGRLTDDPELGKTKGGAEFAKFSIASNEVWGRGEEREERTCFCDVSVYGAQANPVVAVLQKGSRVIVDGNLRHERWEAKDGSRRSRHTIVGQRVTFADPPPRDDDERHRREPMKEEPHDFDPRKAADLPVETHPSKPLTDDEKLPF